MEELLEAYRESTRKSYGQWMKSSRFLPGGNTRTSVYFKPYPVYLKEGDGCRVRDLDDNEYVDYLNNYTSLILGHRHPRILRAIERAASMGTAFSAPTELEYEHSEILSSRVPSVEKVRYANSGSEAVMFALRGARAFTGRNKVAKFEGAYHGSYDSAEVSVAPDGAASGPPDHPFAVAESEGIPPSVKDDVVVLPYNDPGASEEIIRSHKGDLAAVIMEPITGRMMVPAEKDFARAVREVTASNGILLIYDEVIAFRVDRGGGQRLLGVKPDMTVFGKIIGGGFPVGAFGGREDIMELFDPAGSARIEHAGTFNANVFTLSAGIETLKALTPSLIGRLNTNGAAVRKQLGRLFSDNSAAASVTGLGSLFQVHTCPEPPRNYRDTLASDRGLRRRLFFSLLLSGDFFASRLTGCISEPMAQRELRKLVDDMGDALEPARKRTD